VNDCTRSYKKYQQHISKPLLSPVDCLTYIYEDAGNFPSSANLVAILEPHFCFQPVSFDFLVTAEIM
jgi:hypothetical protein